MEHIITIKGLLDPDFTQLSAHSIRAFEKTDNMQQLRLNLQQNVPNHQWSLVREEVLTQVSQLLDIPLHPILVKSWHTHEAVHREVQLQQAHPDNHEASIVVLDTHEIRSTHSPTLSTKVGQNFPIDLRFFIGIVLQLKHISLKIQQGEIKAILAGVISGSGFMQYQNITLLEKDFVHFKPAGNIQTIPIHESNNNDREGQVIPETSINDISSISDTTDIVPNRMEPHIDNNTETVEYLNNQTPKPMSNVIDIKTENRYKKTSPRTFTQNLVQFTLGVSLAFVGLFMFWRFVMGQ